MDTYWMNWPPTEGHTYEFTDLSIFGARTHQTYDDLEALQDLYEYLDYLKKLVLGDWLPVRDAGGTP